MFFSYFVGGTIIVIPYFFLSVRAGIILSVIFACLALFGLGYYKGYLTKINKIKSGLEMFGIAIVVAAVGYIIGSLIGRFIGLLS